MIENIDSNFGLLMKKLAEWKQLENTLVIFMTDNGMSMGRFKVNGKQETAFNANMKGTKNSLWEGGTRVPSFWYLKGKTQDGSDIPALAGDVDFYKTFCALTGAKIPESKLPPGGRSLLPLLENPKADWEDRSLFFNKGRWGSKGLTKEKAKYASAVRTQKWRLVHNKSLYDVNNDLMQENDLASPAFKKNTKLGGNPSKLLSPLTKDSKPQKRATTSSKNSKPNNSKKMANLPSGSLNLSSPKFQTTLLNETYLPPSPHLLRAQRPSRRKQNAQRPTGKVLATQHPCHRCR